MKSNLLLVFLVLFLGTGIRVQAQYEQPYGVPEANNAPEWVNLLYQQPVDLGLVLDAFHDYYQNHPFVKNSHTQYLKRLLRESETYEAQFKDPATRQTLKQQERAYLQKYNQQQAERNGNWTCIGPFDWDHDAEGRSYAPGSAHVYTVEKCGSVMYAGTATAGLWKSTDGGANWTNVSKDLMASSVYAVEIDPSNCTTVYASIGGSIYRSTDGGASWSATGDANFQALSLEVYDIKISPASGKIFAGTNNGLYSSTNGGVTWAQSLSGEIQEIEFKPDDATVMYLVRQTGTATSFLKSENSGTSFTAITNGWPVPPTGAENKRAEIAVTPANPNKVYALLTGSVNGSEGLYGVYVSNNAGASWTFNCCGPQPGGTPSPSNINMMGWDDLGQDAGGQYYYDLGLAVSATDENKVFVGGVNLWVSNDGGASFTCPAKWSHPHKPNYVHADIHDINIYGSSIWLACDGGIFVSNDNGASFERSSYGIAGSDFWGFGLGHSNDEVMLGGAYHNGTLLKNGSVYLNDWICTDGGDGVGGAVNPIKEDQVYSNYNIKILPPDRTTPFSTRNFALEPTWHYQTGRFSQLEFGQDNYNVHYFGSGNGLYKTEDDNNTVSLIHDFGEEVADVEISWTNPLVMYVSTYPGYWDEKRLYKTTDGGFTWTNITPSTAVYSSRRYTALDVEVSYNNENIIWIARLDHQTDDNKKVFRSNDGGQTWTNISGTALDGEVLTNIVAQRGTNDHLYLGTTRTVYHSQNGTGSWQLFSMGLPASTRSRQLAISYRTNKIYNATNRSVWVADLPETSQIVPQMSVNTNYVGCVRDTFFFADYSTAPASGTSYQWSFPGASWVSSTTARSPAVYYGVPGQYSATLTINGAATQEKVNFVEVGNECSPNNYAGGAMRSSTSSAYLSTANELGINSNTITIMGWVKPSGIQDDYTGILINDGTVAGLNFRINNEIGYHWPGGSTHWGWSSGLYAPANEWSFVAIVIQPNSVTLYVNDQMVQRSLGTALAQVFWSTIRVGRYQDWSSRTFKGDMDEVVFWNRALSSDEIRLWRHRTKHHQGTPGDALYDPSLLLYFQFNEADGLVYDRVGNTHGTLKGTAQRTASTAPVGDGTSAKLTVSGAGTFNFSEQSLKIIFPAGGTYPNGDLVATLLTNSPDQLPFDGIIGDRYWVINNYGTNSTFTAPSSIEFSGISGISAGEAALPGQYILYKRPSNADGETWGTYIDQADAATTTGKLTFSTGNGITSFSQFTIGQDASLLPVELLDLWLKPLENGTVAIHWQVAQEYDMDGYVIEHSSNGRDFLPIGRIAAENSLAPHEYSLVHEKPTVGWNYYRIRSVAVDGEEQISDTLAYFEGKEGDIINLYPNPLPKGGLLHLSTNISGEAFFELYNTSGALLRKTIFTQSASINLAGLPAGSYGYRVVQKDGEIVLKTGFLLQQ